MRRPIARVARWRTASKVCCRSTRTRRSHDLIRTWTSCAIDKGGPLEIGFQEQVSNHLQAAVVKSHGSVRWRKSVGRLAQVRIRETNESEPIDDASLAAQVPPKPGALPASGINPLDT